MSLPPILHNLRIPVIASPMFIVSNPELVIAQCKAGIVGSFPALNARPAEAPVAIAMTSLQSLRSTSGGSPWPASRSAISTRR